MIPMTLSAMDQRFLDLMDRIEQTQQQQLAALASRLEAAEWLNHALEQRIAALEAQNTRLNTSLTSLNASLAQLLGPSAPPP